jgi:hypothetical protein
MTMLFRRLLTITACLLIFIAGCNEQMAPTISLLSGGNVDFDTQGEEYIGRVGAQIDKTEIGMSSQWIQGTENNQQNFGVYVIQDLIFEPNTPLLGNWYLGAQATIDFDSDGGIYGPIVGTKSYLGGIEILTEFQYRHYNEALKALEESNDDKYRIFIGPRFKF